MTDFGENHDNGIDDNGIHVQNRVLDNTDLHLTSIFTYLKIAALDTIALETY